MADHQDWQGHRGRCLPWGGQVGARAPRAAQRRFVERIPTLCTHCSPVCPLPAAILLLGLIPGETLPHARREVRLGKPPRAACSSVSFRTILLVETNDINLVLQRTGLLCRWLQITGLTNQQQMEEKSRIRNNWEQTRETQGSSESK